MSYRITSLINTEKEMASYSKRLSICLTPNGFSFSRRTIQNLLLTFGEVECDFNQPMVQLTALIKDCCVALHISPFDFDTMDLFVPVSQSVWIPDALFDPDHERDYLGTVSALPMGSALFTSHSDVLGACNVFVADNNIVTAFKIVLPGIDVHSQHQVLVSSQLMFDSESHPVIVMHQRQDYCDFAVANNGKLLLSTTYVVHNADERLYRAIEVMKTLAIEQDDTELKLCGIVGREDYAAMRKFFPKVSLFNGVPMRFAIPEFQHLHTYQHVITLGMQY